jgi:hypothetical protein
MRTIYKCSECLVYPSCSAVCLDMKNPLGLLTSNIRNGLKFLLPIGSNLQDSTTSKIPNGLRIVFNKNSSWPLEYQQVIAEVTNDLLEKYFKDFNIIDLINSCDISYNLKTQYIGKVVQKKRI